MVTYEALRPLTSTTPDGQSHEIAPGGVVVGFESWDLRNQISAINVHMVRERLDGSAPRPLSERANETELREARERLIAAAVARQSGALKQPELATAVEQATEVEPILRCGACDYSTHSAQGLKTHKARKHKA